MNRIILIGNGFDLAHGIKTSYSHFITNYWKKMIQELRSEVNRNVTVLTNTFEREEISIENVPGGPFAFGDWVRGDSLEELVGVLNERQLKLTFKNRFLEILTQKHKERDWVDIENEYYALLKESYRNARTTYSIEKLNKDLGQIEKRLKRYLSEVEENFNGTFGNAQKNEEFKQQISSKMYSPFIPKDFTELAINKMAEVELVKLQKAHESLKLQSTFLSDLNLNPRIQKLMSVLDRNWSVKDIRKLLMSDDATSYFDLMPEQILFLNFNYTSIEKKYLTESEFDFPSSSEIPIKKCLHIHGTLDKHDHNEVIFGFGDEMDEDYQLIENLNDNNYLANIKSIRYLETDNYKQLLEFLNANEYQIFIFGHSCGISDRTLLNTLFEHKNCSSIKPFYYQKEDGSDNYSDIVRNISRNFNNKTNMRDKVVNKTYCETLT